MNIHLRSPAEIGLAELESRFGTVTRVRSDCALVSGEVDIHVLGGTVKTATVLSTIDGTDMRKAFRNIEKLLPHLAAGIPEGKIKLGLSLYGLDMKPFAINGQALRLKKQLTKPGRSVRTVPNISEALSSAQTFHNQLAAEKGLEFIIVVSADKTYIGRVTGVQDIDAYRIRDRERPKRDAFVGMLPPKLAQVMISLAGAKKSSILWDPFCGTGVVLMEALLQEINAYGSDKSAKMVDYTRANTDWLMQRQNMSATGSLDMTSETFPGDATEVKLPLETDGSSLSIVTETYLGQPLGGQSPSEEKIQTIMHDVNSTIRAFLKNIAPQVVSGSRHCVAIPAWYAANKTYRLPVIEELDELGFERVHFAYGADEDLIYRREDQVTGRELLVIVKK